MGSVFTWGSGFRIFWNSKKNKKPSENELSKYWHSYCIVCIFGKRALVPGNAASPWTVLTIDWSLIALDSKTNKRKVSFFMYSFLSTLSTPTSNIYSTFLTDKIINVKSQL